MRILMNSISDTVQGLHILLWFVAYSHNEENASFQWELNKRYNFLFLCQNVWALSIDLWSHEVL